MHPSPYPTRPTPEPALHLLGGIWIATCPTCGYQLVTEHYKARRTGSVSSARGHRQLPHLRLPAHYRPHPATL